MKDKAIYFLLGYHIFTRTLTDYLDSDTLYWFLDAGFIGAVAYFMFVHSEKNLTSKLTLGCVFLLAINQGINTSVMMLGYEPIIYLRFLLWFFVAVDLCLMLLNRIKWVQ